jgi:hypothetical protein
MSTQDPGELLRKARVGDLLPDALLGPRSARRNEAIALIAPASGGLDSYVARLEAHRADFAGWDGRLVVMAPTGASVHRMLIADRYGQVYAVHQGAVDDLPDAAALTEWFRFLATACPECGVLDDPIGRGWVP